LITINSYILFPDTAFRDGRRFQLRCLIMIKAQPLAQLSLPQPEKIAMIPPSLDVGIRQMPALKLRAAMARREN
jgi:hypothetical protein